MDRKELYQSVLEKFSTEITESEGCYIVRYSEGFFEGTCKYVEKSGMSKIQPRGILLLTESDMGDVIEYIHKKSPLSSEDLSSMNKLIRDHSLLVVENYLNDRH